jgi:hypothetical protein
MMPKFLRKGSEQSYLTSLYHLDTPPFVRVIVRISVVDVGISIHIVLPCDASNRAAGSFETSTVTGDEVDAGKISIMELVDLGLGVSW